MCFKCFSPGGNLLAMVVDLEAAQVLGAADAFLPTIDAAYSGINVTASDELIPYFVKCCVAHVKQ
jgi:hypothetical protein